MQFSQLPAAALLYFPESHWWSEIFSLSKVILVSGKVRSHRTPNMGCRGAESPGWFDVSQNISAHNMMHAWAHCHDEAANHQLPIAMDFWIIQIVSAEECSSLMQNLMQIHCSTHSECDRHTAHMHPLNSTHCPHWLVQWSHHCPCMCTLVHCPYFQVTSMLHKPFSLY